MELSLTETWQKKFLVIGFILSILFTGLSIYTNNFLFALIPFGGISVFFLIHDYRFIFYLFFFLLPFSIEYNFTPSLGTDLPSEPIMLVLFGVCILLFAQKVNKKGVEKYFHPITYLLLLHLGWILITAIASEHPVNSFKIFLAKLWYILPFYFLSIHILNSKEAIRKMIVSGIYTLTLSIVYVLFRHYQVDFAFDQASIVVMPIFRNHVSYACIIVIFVPYLWCLFIWEQNKLKKFFYGAMMLFYSVAIYYSYTRAAILALVLAIIAYYIIKFRMLKPVILLFFILTTIGLTYSFYNNNYLKFTPNYEKTITHDEFGKLITATYNMEDISTMERLYRWVAGVEMIKDKPWLGFGPGSFYTFYKGYTVSSFQTYVSNNPDQSTVHNYFLLIFIEQGVFGFIIFMALCLVVLLYGEKYYHESKNRFHKSIIMASILGFIIILLLNLINDMIETDKVGPFFFLSMAMIAGSRHFIDKEEKEAI